MTSGIDSREGGRLAAVHLVAVLATPPAHTSGERTLARVRLAAGILGAVSVSATNLLLEPTADVLDIGRVGRDRGAWLAARFTIDRALFDDALVLFGWGVSRPPGPAAVHHREQVAWVTELVHARGLQSWTVGGRPRHPSRWQRYTNRVHPGVPFADALAASLTAVPL